jgi:hypothetical protein
MITTMAEPNARPSRMAMVSRAATANQPHRDGLLDAAYEGFYSNIVNRLRKLIKLMKAFI